MRECVRHLLALPTMQMKGCATQSACACVRACRRYFSLSLFLPLSLSLIDVGLLFRCTVSGAEQQRDRDVHGESGWDEGFI